jgi:hypothetical protein
MSRRAADPRAGMRRGRLLTAFWAAAVLLLGPVGAAEAYVYWSSTGSGAIGRADNDGTNVDPKFISGLNSPIGLTVDSGHIYWSSLSGDAIGRANIDGTGVDQKFISGLDEPNGVAVGSGFVFWSEGAQARIGRANVDGSNVIPNLVTGIAPCGVAVDAGNVYWASQEGPPAHIGRAALGGVPFDVEFVTIPAAEYPCGVAVSSSYIFWADTEVTLGTKIGRADLTSGQNVNASFVGNAKVPCGVAAFAGSVYWANALDGTIGRGAEAGGGVDQAFIATGGITPCGVAVDALAPPLQHQGGGTANQPAADTTPPRTKILRGPGNRLRDGKASFLYDSGEAATFTCKLDARKPARCGRRAQVICYALGPQCLPHRTYKGLAPGSHLFRVWATDTAGNKDLTPARRRFRVPAP